MLMKTGKAVVIPPAMTTQIREDSDSRRLPPLTILCWRTLLVITKHREDGPDIAQMDNTTTKHHNQVDYILVRKRLRSGVTIARTRSFPGPDIESNNDFLMMTFHLRLKREKLKDPNVFETLQTMIGGRFAPLAVMSNEDVDIDLMTTTFNTAVTETASEIFGKHCQTKITWVTAESFDLCDKRGKLKKKRFEPEGSEKYREGNNNIKRCMIKAKDNCAGE